MFTESLPSNNSGIQTWTSRLMGGIYEYEVCRLVGLRCYEIHTKFHKNWFSHSEVSTRDSQTHRQHGDNISVLLFFQNKESRLKRDNICSV
jgi:hypothetical protein